MSCSDIKALVSKVNLPNDKLKKQHSKPPMNLEHATSIWVAEFNWKSSYVVGELTSSNSVNDS